MTFPFPFGQTVIHIDRSTVLSKDAMGVEVRSTTQVTLTQIPFWQQTTVVEVQGQTQVREESFIVVPIGTSVNLADQFIVASRLYRVDGEPWSLVSPMTGTAPGIQVKLELVTG